MKFFILMEAIQFFAGAVVVIISYVLIRHHRRPLLESSFGGNEKVRHSFEVLTSFGYFMIFAPMLIFGIDIAPPQVYFPADHVQRIIYFEAGLVFLIGALHFAIVSIFSMKIK